MWQVDDFDWLKAQQSPHWSVLPEAERRDASLSVQPEEEGATPAAVGE